MSLVAKVFVVLNLLVSVAFLVFAMNMWAAPTKFQRLYELEKVANVEALANVQKVQVEAVRALASRDSDVESQKKKISELVVAQGRLQDQLLDVQATRRDPKGPASRDGGTG